MRLKWHFRNEATLEFNNRPAFSSKSSWNPPTDHPNLEVFLSQIEHKRFQIPDVYLIPIFLRKNSRLLIQWQKINLLLLKNQKRNFMCWDRLDYFSEGEKQLDDKIVYKNVSFNDKILLHLVETSNNMFLNLKRKGWISEKEIKYFVYNNKIAGNLGKLHFFPKINKRLSNVPGRSVISNCGISTKKTFKFLEKL